MSFYAEIYAKKSWAVVSIIAKKSAALKIFIYVTLYALRISSVDTINVFIYVIKESVDPVMLSCMAIYTVHVVNRRRWEKESVIMRPQYVSENVERF